MAAEQQLQSVRKHIKELEVSESMRFLLHDQSELTWNYHMMLDSSWKPINQFTHEIESIKANV